MSTSLSDFLTAMVRATAALSLSAVIAWGVLSWFKLQSPRVVRIVWLLVLLQGIVLLRIPVAIPWYPAAARFTMPLPVSEISLPRGNLQESNDSTIPAPSTGPKANAPINWQPMIFGAWLAGCGITLLWWGVVYLRIARRGAIGKQPEEEWKTEWQSLCERSGSPTIPLRITDDTGPVLIWRPRGAEVLVPRELWASLPSPQRLAILRHELAHFRRGDLWKGALIRLLALVHWFNPLAWWVVRNLEECAEWLCDDAASGADHAAATEYAEVLLRLGQQPRNLGVWATAMRGGRLHRRICRVLSPMPKERSIMKKSLLVGIPLVLLTGNLIRVQLVARAQGTNAGPLATASTTTRAPGQPETGIPIRGNYLTPGGLGEVLAFPAIQKELGIEKGSPQYDEMRKLGSAGTQEIQEGLTEDFQKHPVDTQAERQKRQSELLMGLYVKHDRELEKLLKPDQITRVRQIILQDAGANALADPEVQKDLAITKDQQEKLADLYTDVREQKLKVFAPDGKVNRETDSILQQLKDIDAKRDQRGTEILTKEQQQKFAELKGKPYDLSTLPPQYAGRGPRMPFGFRRGGLMELALMDPVMKELGINKDAPQVPELRKLTETYFAETGKEFQRMRHDQIEVEIANPFRIAPTVQAKIDPELKKLLTPEQFTRLRQINWQSEGVAALYDPAIEEALEITSDQQKQLSDLNYENQRKQIRLLNPRDGEPRITNDEIQKKGAELNAERDRKINEILTKSQQDKFSELKGKPFDLALLRRPTAGNVSDANSGKGDNNKKDAP
jgi:beta-lactamase regulating signal transducer with metallopeptidase domain